jgi:hypothetical protein
LLWPKGLAVLVAAALLSACDHPPLPTRNAVVQDVDGSDLILDDSAARVSRGIFEIGYAIKANYAYFAMRSIVLSVVAAR